MAQEVAKGIESTGAVAELFTPDSFSADMVENYEKIALGCPSMGAEELEETEFLPMYEEIEPELKGKKVVLFGSYSWGDGEWMRTWQESALDAGLILAADYVIANEEPDEDALLACHALGQSLANS